MTILCFHNISETIFFTVHNDDTIRAGPPPKQEMDNYFARAAQLGRFRGVSAIAFSPEGKLYAVRGEDLYVGPMPSAGKDWFSVARRVGKVDWKNVKTLLFHPKGDLYVITKDGGLFKGPAPDNEYVSWLYGRATQIGRKWNTLEAVFFDPEGMMYAVTSDDRFVKRSPPTSIDDNWTGTSVTIGHGNWRDLTHFMSFTPDGKLWCVQKDNGNIYYADPPVAGIGVYHAKRVGWNYHINRLNAFTRDKTIQRMISLEFLPDLGKVISENLEVVQEKTYDNKRSSVPLKHSFSFTKTIKQSSEFSHEHGFTCEVGAEMTFKAGIPGIAEQGLKLTVNLSTTHTWSFTETNETEVSFSSSSDVEVPEGKAIRVIASVRKAEMEMPYRAKVRTLFGYETNIEGTWRGVAHFNLTVAQEDI
ncbi:uncharacterized protein LOC128467588 [Spea bombifrons]|uniref:uncharacterized protein LOC128467588 n=1 Tax=Spea bombifrons TaxID=233779 RepID=UPI00234AFE70|nr:uncharacterized protein LOC128467588 [Spea bombifrons]